MNSSKTIVKLTVSKDIDLHHSTEATAATPGRPIGQKAHVEITPEHIRIRAYEIYLARNGGPGDPAADWCQAELELIGRADAEPACDDSIADSAVLDIKTRSDAQRQPATSVRGGL